MDISTNVMRQLEEAQAAVTADTPMAGPPIATGVTTSQTDVFGFSAAGSGQVAHVLVDHYFTSTNAFLWAYSANGWKHATLSTDDEQGIAKVAFEANRVDVWWTDSNKVTMLRCWKTF
jgi:hypothetical protein